MRTGLTTLASILVALLSLVACSGDAREPEQPPTVASAMGTGAPQATAPATPEASTGSTPSARDKGVEDDVAASLLITLDDLPVGWTEDISGEESDAYEECELNEADGGTGAAQTGEFSAGGDSFVHATTVFESPVAAEDALARFESYARCIVQAMNDGAVDTDEAEISRASLSRGRTPAHGDAGIHLRISFHVRAKGATGLGSAGDAHFDVVGIRVGRFASAILATGFLRPFDASFLEELVGVGSSRITEASSVR